METVVALTFVYFGMCRFCMLYRARAALPLCMSRVFPLRSGGISYFLALLGTQGKKWVLAAEGRRATADAREVDRARSSPFPARRAYCKYPSRPHTGVDTTSTPRA